MGSSSLTTTSYFTPGLQLVKLKGEVDALCWELSKRLRGEYGTPLSSGEGRLTSVWKDHIKSNRLRCTWIGDIAPSEYPPLSTVAKSEL